MNKTYAKDVLYAPYTKKVYTEKHTQAAFLLGGIGTGNISLGSRGELRDVEIFNTPGKGNTSNYTFFSIWTKKEEEDPKVRILESKLQGPYLNSSIGYSAEKYAGLPRFKKSKMTSEYPFVEVALEDEKMPVEVKMEAFTPFIPLNPDDSGIPGAYIRYQVKNTTDESVDVAIAGSLTNLVGYKENANWGFIDAGGEAHNEKKIDGDVTGIFMDYKGVSDKSVKKGSLALMTKETDVTVKPNWYDGAWWDGIQEFWNDFCDDGELVEQVKESDQTTKVGHKTSRVGSMSIKKHLAPGEVKTFEFILTWYIPNRIKDWSEDVYNIDIKEDNTIKNYYGTQHENAWGVGRYLIDHKERLEKDSRSFTEALYSSTLPQDVIESLANNITVIRSNTCFRIEGGDFLAWEGCHDRYGSCHGTCTHVWNYAQTLAFLFPTLEQSARQIEFNVETDEEGKMNFRTEKLLREKSTWEDMHPAADGQMGTVLRLYREWKLSGDDTFLKSVWDNAKKALEYAFTHWDQDQDFVLDSQQHNTYDIEFYGANSLVNSVFYVALKAAAEMADYLGETDVAEKYRTAYKQGIKRMDEILWEGDFYTQRIEDVNAYKYQYGKGCLSDQVFGQTLAHITGLGYILPEKHVKKAIKAVFDHNFITKMEDHMSVQRTYALDEEAGLVLCTWPKGGRPELPFVYSDEVWTGIEYQVATHLIYEGFIDEGLTVNKAVRDRYDGLKRNPWSELECGHHYARSLASWGLLLALSGFKYDMTKEEMSFNPLINEEDFKCFWSTGKAWGTYSQSLNDQGEMVKELKKIYTCQ